MIKLPAKSNIRIVRDWEERLSLFLQAAIDQPHMEPEICEDLIEYVHNLVLQEKNSYRQRISNVLLRVFGQERRNVKLHFAKGKDTPEPYL